MCRKLPHGDPLDPLTSRVRRRKRSLHGKLGPEPGGTKPRETRHRQGRPGPEKRG